MSKVCVCVGGGGGGGGTACTRARMIFYGIC